MTSSNANIFRVTGHLCGHFPAQRPVTRMFSLICAWINGWVNNREAGDLRRQRSHNDVPVMWRCKARNFTGYELPIFGIFLYLVWQRNPERFTTRKGVLLHLASSSNEFSWYPIFSDAMMTSSNGNIFRFTGHLCLESPVTGEFPHKGQWREALMFSLICAWKNGWINNREAGDLRRHRIHYDVTVMQTTNLIQWYSLC